MPATRRSKISKEASHLLSYNTTLIFKSLGFNSTQYEKHFFLFSTVISTEFSFIVIYLFIYFLNTVAQVLPSWNVTIAYKTSSSLTIRWSNFPLSVPIQWFLVRYKEHNSSFSLIYKVSNWYNSHYSGSVLRTYQSYEVDVIAVANNSGNGAYSSEPTIARTNEGGKNQKITAKIDPTIKAKYNKLNKTFFFHSLLFFSTVSGKKQTNKQTKKQYKVGWKKILNPSLQLAVLLKALVIISSDYDHFFWR